MLEAEAGSITESWGSLPLCRPHISRCHNARLRERGQFSWLDALSLSLSQRTEVISRALVGGRASSPKLRCWSPLWTQLSETQATDQISVQLAFAGELALPTPTPVRLNTVVLQPLPHLRKGISQRFEGVGSLQKKCSLVSESFQQGERPCQQI